MGVAFDCPTEHPKCSLSSQSLQPELGMDKALFVLPLCLRLSRLKEGVQDSVGWRMSPSSAVAQTLALLNCLKQTHFSGSLGTDWVYGLQQRRLLGL